LIIEGLYDVPFIFWNTQEQTAIEPDSDISVLFSNNSISTIPHAANILFQFGKDFSVFTGTHENPKIKKRFKDYFTIVRTAKHLREMRIGSIGTMYPGMITCSVNEASLRDLIGPSVIHISMPDVVEAIKHISGAEVEAEAKLIKDTYPIRDLSDQEIRQSAKIYLGMKKLLDGRDIDVLADICNLMILEKEIGLAPCYAMTKLADEGMHSACETDILVATSIAIANDIAGNAWFTEFYMMDMDKEMILCGHCGYAPTENANPKYPVKACPTACYPGALGMGLGFEFSAKPGQAVLLSLVNAPCGFKMIATEIDVQDFAPIPANCPHAVIKFRNLGFEEGIEAFAKSGASHHFVLVFGDNAKQFEALADFIGIDFELV
jgi:L-arabinose isomerase